MPVNPLDDLVTKPNERALHRCRFPAPNRVWEEVSPGQWSSRRWREGEKEKYEREVLGQ